MQHPTTEKAWFESWFDSPYYHILYRHRDTRDAQRFMSNLIEALPLRPNDRILDLACGKGRHAIYLNSMGLDVVGVDLSEQNIAHAQQRENERLHFAEHDMREVFEPRAFDVVLNLFTSFGYFEGDQENAQVIAAATRNLKAEGVLLVDFMNVAQVLNNLKTGEEQEHEGIRFHIRRELEAGYIVKRIHFQDQGRQHRFQERVKALSKDDFLRYFQHAGLEILHIWGDYELSPFQPETSDRLIMVGRRKTEALP